MNNAEIIKALECCISNDGNCNICHQHSRTCINELLELALDLINRQKAEIERLQDENKNEKLYNLRMTAHSVKTEAIKEFAERLKEECSFECDVSLGYGRPCYEDSVPIIAIDNLVKEMTGEC